MLDDRSQRRDGGHDVQNPAGRIRRDVAQRVDASARAGSFNALGGVDAHGAALVQPGRRHEAVVERAAARVDEQVGRRLRAIAEVQRLLAMVGRAGAGGEDLQAVDDGDAHGLQVLLGALAEVGADAGEERRAA